MGSKRAGTNGYRGVMEGDEAHVDSVVRAGEDRKGSTRGVERRMPATEDGLDYRLRRRLAEVLSSAGVDEGRVAVEILYLLPQEFVRGYEDLFHRALTTGEEGRGERDDQKAELGRGRKAAAKAPKKTGRGIWVVRNDRALGEKERVDRALRKLARGMKDAGGAGVGKDAVRKCGEARAERKTPIEDVQEGRSCGKWLEAGWKWCPFCGREQS